MSDQAPDVSIMLHKRSASVAGLNEKPPRSTKRRAPKACQCCRSRKVRCNVTESGPPCTNCRLDEVECLVTESKRKRRSFPKLEEDAAHAPAALKPPRLVRPAVVTTKDTLKELAALPQERASLSGSANEHVPHSLYRSHNARPNISDSFARMPLPFWHVNTFPHEQTTTVSEFSGSSGHHGPYFTPASSRNGTALPYYLKPVPLHVGADEIIFLHKKSALSVPDAPLRDTILRAYVEFVHPFTPVLDLADFLQIVRSDDGSHGRISLLLFQAVMFAGVAFVDDSRLREAGYGSRKEARRSFFQKSRLLYDFDYDADGFTQIQALLLMASWYDSPEDKKDGWHWMGIAIAAAYTIGLHQDPARSSMELQKQRQCKRTWWALVVRDHLIALGLRRPTRIRLSDCDVPMLTLDDFEMKRLPSGPLGTTSECAMANDLVLQQSMAEMCIALTKLCLCINNVLTTQYSVHNPESGVEDTYTRTAAALVPKKSNSATPKFEACHNELDVWYNNNRLDLAEDVEQPGDAPLIVHRTVLHMIYLATVTALHKPQLIQPLPSSDSEAIQQSRQQVDHAAKQTTEIAKILLERDFVRFLPVTGITVLCHAIATHVQALQTASGTIWQRSVQGLAYGILAMQALQDSYSAATHSLTLIEAAIQRVGITPPNSTSTTTMTPTSADSSSSAQSDQDVVQSPTIPILLQTAIELNLISSSLMPPTTLPLAPGQNSRSTISFQKPHPIHFQPHTINPDPSKFDALLAISTPPDSNASYCGTSAWGGMHSVPEADGVLGFVDKDFVVDAAFGEAATGDTDKEFESFVNLDGMGLEGASWLEFGGECAVAVDDVDEEGGAAWGEVLGGEVDVGI